MNSSKASMRGRATLPIPRPPLASRVTTFLAKLQPPADDDDRAAIENARKLVAFLLRNDDKRVICRRSRRRGRPPAVCRQLRALSPVVNERRDDLRLFGTKLAARLAEKQLARNFGAQRGQPHRAGGQVARKSSCNLARGLFVLVRLVVLRSRATPFFASALHR